jgi:hypothetical protein
LYFRKKKEVDAGTYLKKRKSSQFKFFICSSQAIQVSRTYLLKVLCKCNGKRTDMAMPSVDEFGFVHKGMVASAL